MPLTCYPRQPKPLGGERCTDNSRHQLNLVLVSYANANNPDSETNRPAALYLLNCVTGYRCHPAPTTVPLCN